MIKYLLNRKLVSCVGAEFKAQCKDQSLVRCVCYTEEGVITILDLGNHRFYNKNKFRYFMITTFLLAHTLSMNLVEIEIKVACAKYLKDRLDRINHSRNNNSSWLSDDNYDDLMEICRIGDNEIRKYLSMDANT